MNAVAILGLQWGNEGKGKITDSFSEEADYIVKYQGGNTIKRTFELESGKKITLRSMSLGLVKNTKGKQLFTSAAVLNLSYLIDDIKLIKQENPNIENQILIDGKVNLIMPHHTLIDRISEESRGDTRIGTTLTGVGPTYMDKVSRFGIRFVDLFYRDSFYKKLKSQVEVKKALIEHFRLNHKSDLKLIENFNIDIDATFEQCMSYADYLRPMLVDAFSELYTASRENRKVLFEGSQSTMLDIDHGTYPYVTSSSPTAGGIASSAGIPPYFLREIVGVFKAYSTRTGIGFFPSEMKPSESDIIEKIIKKGSEYIEMEGELVFKRCGWLDIPQLRYSIMINGITKLVLTKIDVLSGLDKIKIVTSYILKGKRYETFSSIVNAEGVDEVEYMELPGWEEDILGIREYEELPENCINVIKTIEKLLDFPISIISTSIDRHSNIILY